MARRHLSEEERHKIASREWKRVRIWTSDEKLIKRAKNLTGPKTKEGKMRSLQNLQVGRNSMDKPTNFRHGGFIRRILNEEEQEWYMQRREDYLKDYDINQSADEARLHTVLMEEVIQYRLWKRQSENPSMDIDRPLTESDRRHRVALEDLGALRKQRLKQDDKISAINIATLAQQFFRNVQSGSIQEILDAQKSEEEEYRKQIEKRALARSSSEDIIEGDVE
jgi:hypothetical protein